MGRAGACEARIIRKVGPTRRRGTINDPVKGRYVGMDVSKVRLDVTSLLRRAPVECFSVANDPEGIDALVGRLRGRVLLS